MTQQEIFNKVWNHLLTQDKQAINDNEGVCLYRAEDGCMCAVGCLIPDELYDPDMEGLDVNNTKVRGVLEEIGLLDQADNLGLLNSLQYIHDHVSSAYWESHLRGVADERHLKVPPVPSKDGKVLTAANQISATTVCPECKGTGWYVGLNSVEPCLTCQGE